MYEDIAQIVAVVRNGKVRLDAGALWDGHKMVEQPLPAGPKPRLALIHINSEAVRTRCPEVELESSARKLWIG